MLDVRDTRHGWLTILGFVLCGLAGGVLAATLAAARLDGRVDPSSLDPLVFLPFGAALVGGVLGGWFVAILVLARPHGGTHCPGCGTVNRRGFTACRACDLRPT